MSWLTKLLGRDEAAQAPAGGDGPAAVDALAGDGDSETRWKVDFTADRGPEPSKDVFAKIGDIKGESGDAEMGDHFKSAIITVRKGGSGDEDPAAFGDIKGESDAVESTPLLQQVLVNNEAMGDPDRPLVLGHLYNADAAGGAVGGNQTESIGAGRSFNVQEGAGPFDVKIEEVVPNAGGDPIPTESISFNFDKFEGKKDEALEVQEGDTGPGDEAPEESITFVYGKLGAAEPAGAAGANELTTDDTPGVEARAGTTEQFFSIELKEGRVEVDDEVLVAFEHGDPSHSDAGDENGVGETFKKAAGDQQQYLEVKLENVQVTSYQLGTPDTNAEPDAGGDTRPLKMRGSEPEGAGGGPHASDSYSFGVEREMKESGEKGGTEDINIGIGELQESEDPDGGGPAGMGELAKKASGDKQEFLEVKMQDILVSSYQTSGHGAESGQPSTEGGAFDSDRLSFGVEREMKESGEKGGTEDINIGIGELQESPDAEVWPIKIRTQEVGDGDHGGPDADRLSFGVEREMKESGEKGGTEDINIGVGELQEVTITKSMDSASPMSDPDGELTAGVEDDTEAGKIKFNEFTIKKTTDAAPDDDGGDELTGELDTDAAARQHGAIRIVKEWDANTPSVMEDDDEEGSTLVSLEAQAPGEIGQALGGHAPDADELPNLDDLDLDDLDAEGIEA